MRCIGGPYLSGQRLGRSSPFVRMHGWRVDCTIPQIWWFMWTPFEGQCWGLCHGTFETTMLIAAWRCLKRGSVTEHRPRCSLLEGILSMQKTQPPAFWKKSSLGKTRPFLVRDHFGSAHMFLLFLHSFFNQLAKALMRWKWRIKNHRFEPLILFHRVVRMNEEQDRSMEHPKTLQWMATGMQPSQSTGNMFVPGQLAELSYKFVLRVQQTKKTLFSWAAA